MASSDALITLVNCSFCEEIFDKSTIREHLILCGNKTDQCPNCNKYIRRAIFAYHYENNCANPDESEYNPNQENPSQMMLIKCTFCEETLDKTRIYEHLQLCGNKTIKCPSCHKYVRKAIFTYHYENNCAYPDENKETLAQMPKGRMESKQEKKTMSAPKECYNPLSPFAGPCEPVSTSVSSLRYRNNKNDNEIKCDHCQEYFPADEIGAHKSIVNSRLDNSLNKCSGCNENILGKNRIEHWNVCKDLNNKVECRYCNTNIVLKCLSIHEAFCKDLIERCDFCHEKVLNSEMKKHIKFCLRNPINFKNKK